MTNRAESEIFEIITNCNETITIQEAIFLWFKNYLDTQGFRDLVTEMIDVLKIQNSENSNKFPIVNLLRSIYGLNDAREIESKILNINNNYLFMTPEDKGNILTLALATELQIILERLALVNFKPMGKPIENIFYSEAAEPSTFAAINAARHFLDLPPFPQPPSPFDFN